MTKKYQTEFTNVIATDGLKLPGILLKHDSKNDSIVIFIHGNGFSSWMNSHEFLSKVSSCIDNADILAFNNRGADYITKLRNTKSGRSEFHGMAYELIKDSIKDIDGAIEKCVSNGYEKIYLCGFSTGANKTVLYNIKGTYKEKVTGYLIVAGGDDTGLRSIRAGDNLDNLISQCKTKIEAGEGRQFVPLEMYFSKHPISYQSLYDMLDPNGDYNIFSFYNHQNQTEGVEAFKYIKQLSDNCIVIYGEKDNTIIYDPKEAIEILREANPNIDYSIIPDGEHSFAETEELLGRVISEWVR